MTIKICFSIIEYIPVGGEMKRMKQFPANNPNPVLSVSTDGTIFYSNEAARTLLHEWDVEVGEKLPSYIDDFIQKAVLQNSPEKMEVNVGKRVYSIAFHPLLKDECVNIYGFDISDYKELEKKLRKSEGRELARSNELAVLLDAVPAAVWITHDPKALHITGNKLSYEWLRIPEGANASKSAPEDERPETFKMFRNGRELQPEEMPVQMSAAGKEIRNYEFDIVYTDGSMRHILGNASTLLDKYGNSTGSISAFIDITERKNIEDALKKSYHSLEEKVKERTRKLEESYNSLEESERRLAKAQRMAHLGNWDRKLANGKLYWSDEMYLIFGLKPQEFEVNYDLYLTFVHPDDRDYVDNAVKGAFRGIPFDIDYRIILSDGQERVVRAQGEVIFNERNTPVQIRGTTQDITEYKKTKEKIQMLANLVESSDDAIITESLDCIITSWNRGAENVYGYSAEEIIGKPISIIAPPYLEAETRELVDRVKQGERIQQYETLRLRKDGKILNVSITLSPVFDIYGKLIAVSLIYRDITKRKEVEEALAKIEITRQKEIHHRIKNNLQVISSLLDLQAGKFRGRGCINESEVLEAFKESHDRVLSIALIHEELHEGEGEEALNFSLYLERLVESLLHTYILGNTAVNLKIDLEESVFFDMDIAVPLGMIVNELVSNSLKYAFPNKKNGEVRIKLFSEKTEDKLNNNEGKFSEKSTQYTLVVSDNGVGIPETIDIKNSETLGLQLVSILVDQLNGTIELKRDGGAEFIVKFTTTEKS